MAPETSLPLFIDSDNALGAPFGDVDDAFAIAFLLKAQARVVGISSIFGNTGEPSAYRNHVALAKICGVEKEIYRGAASRRSASSPAAQVIANWSERTRILAIGPLTNIALALKQNPQAVKNIYDVTLVSTNLSRRLPGFRFFDFNQSQDPRAMRLVFDSAVPLNCVPCDVARKLRATLKDVENIPGPLGKFLTRHSRRWFWRARLLKLVSSVPIWDLAAALYLVHPDLFTTEATRVSIGRWGEAHFGAGEKRPINLVRDFDPKRLWSAFLSRM